MSCTTQVLNRLHRRFVYRIFTVSDSAFQLIRLLCFLPCLQSFNPQHAETSWVWALPLSLATTDGIILIFFSYGYLDVSVPRVRSLLRSVILSWIGLPHSDICGSPDICSLPQLFAAYHVLLRRREPRHPPYALDYFLCLPPGTYRPGWIVLSLLEVFLVCSYSVLFFFSICQ